MDDSGAERRPRRVQTLLLVIGVAVAAALVAANGVGDVLRELAQARFRALAVVAAHAPEIAFAACGWRALLPTAGRPGLVILYQLRLIKEAVNAVLPVAQVGGDLVRARLAASARLPYPTALASCIVDMGLGLASLVVFILAGLAVAYVSEADARLTRIALQLAAGAGLLLATVVVLERLGVGRLIGALMAQARGSLAHLADAGEAVRALAGRRAALLEGAVWHLGSWLSGIFETWVALWALGLSPTWLQAFVLESLIQAIKAVGFAIPASLGVQEGGLIVLCAGLGIGADKALALSLLRRFRDLVIGGIGLLLWRIIAARPKLAVVTSSPGSGE